MICVAEVSKRYDRVVALDRVSLSIGPGERVAFVGTNGSGKTTLLRAVLGLVRFEGRITVGGADVAREPEIALRSVAYIPQIAPPLDAPVGEVARAYATLRGRPLDAITDHARALGLDLGATAQKRFRDLSGGMKQKLLAAMALASEAPILACDEPTANLDGDAREAFFDALDRRPSGSIVILCSHRVEEVDRLVDRVIALRDGRVSDDATVAPKASDRRAAHVDRPNLRVVS